MDLLDALQLAASSLESRHAWKHARILPPHMTTLTRTHLNALQLQPLGMFGHHLNLVKLAHGLQIRLHRCAAAKGLSVRPLPCLIGMNLHITHKKLALQPPYNCFFYTSVMYGWPACPSTISALSVLRTAWAQAYILNTAF